MRGPTWSALPSRPRSLYVLPWGGTGEDAPYWSLGYDALLRADDPRAAGLAFFHEMRERLTDD